MEIIRVKHSGKCFECGGWIMQGEFAYWKKGFGIKHQECKDDSINKIEDDSRLVVIDPDPDFYLK